MPRKLLFIGAGFVAAIAGAWPVWGEQPATPPATPAAAPDQRLFRMNDYFYDRWEESDGTRIQLGDPDVTFILPQLPSQEQAAYVAIFEAAQERGVALWVRFDGSAGRLSADGRRVEFPLCAIEVDGAAHGSVAANCPERSSTTTAGERMLALGLASRTDHRDRALALLRDAAEASDLSTVTRAMALRARGYLGLDQALRVEPGNPDYDRILVEALGDFRRVVELDPDDVEAQFGIARALAELGAYDEALAAYESLGSEGESGYRAAIASGAIHRLLGDYEAALRPLDELVRRQGPQEGMRFNYHRGWTLNLLGRYAEAVDAFTEGLRGQADYPYALIKRSCAFAQLGRHHEALEDQERALEMLRSQAASDPAPWSGQNIAHSEAAVRRLRDAVAGGQQTPIAEICEEPDDGLGQRRARSPMLPPVDR